MAKQPFSYSTKKSAIFNWAEQLSSNRSSWLKRHKYYHTCHFRYLRFLIPRGKNILALGCGTGDALAQLKPARSLGVDFSPGMISEAKARHPNLEFLVFDIEDNAFFQTLDLDFAVDIVLLGDSLGYLDDIQLFLNNLQTICNSKTRIVSSYYGYLWEPILKVAEFLGFQIPSTDTTWLRMGDVEHFFNITGFECVKKEWRLLCPFRLLGIGTFVNSFIATLPLLRRLCIRQYLVARSTTSPRPSRPSISIAIPCKNERGNIEPAIRRIPDFGVSTEIIFVEGGSTDGTWDEIKRVKDSYPQKTISFLKQPGHGKGDAVRAAFSNATGDVLMILDADLTVPPEDLPRFYEAIAHGQGEYINGSRLIYGMEHGAMRTLNFLANHVFAQVFSYLLNQRITDTLCGTKVLTRSAYKAIVANRSYFGDFDPFGDFDLIFGASKLNLKFLEIPVRYGSRKYGATQISRFRHGLLLLKMAAMAYKKLKAV
jgi:SAM-dependent methyltransferase